jgi:hypothetical protein
VVDNLDQANMVVAVSNGNSGPACSPSSRRVRRRARSAPGASSVPHFVGAPVTFAGKTVVPATGDFKTVTADLTAPLGVAAPVTGDFAERPAHRLHGAAESDRPDRRRLARHLRLHGQGAQRAGGGRSGGHRRQQHGRRSDRDGQRRHAGPADPAGLHGREGSRSAADRRQRDPGDDLATLAYFQTANADIMAGFSSQGPTDVDFRIKPDVVAPASTC